jgi:hypothetical protein
VKLCPSIPSSVAAYKLVRPDASAVPEVLFTWAGRAVLIGIGLAVAQRKDAVSTGHLVRDSLFAAAALEGFLLAYANSRTRAFQRGELVSEETESPCAATRKP